jgi:hypothetical protein
LHQHQREVKTSTRNGETLEYIEATKEDVKLAHSLVRQVLGPSFDELQIQTRRLLVAIDRMVAAESERSQIERNQVQFTRRTVRQYTRWGDTQLRLHMKRLEDMEYLSVKRGGNGQTFVYQMCVDLEGVTEVDGEDLHHNRAGLEGDLAGGARVPSGGVAGGARGDEWPVSMRAEGDFYRNPQECSGTGDGEKSAVHPIVNTAKPKPNGSVNGKGNGRTGGKAWPA